MQFQRNKKQLTPVKLDDLFEQVTESISKQLNCMKIGRIILFDETDQTAKIQISFKMVIQVNDDGSEKLQDYPVLIKCPCIFLGGSDSYLTMPVKEGDNCLVFFCDRDIDNWFVQGEDVSLNSYRTHDISDGIALIGVRNKTNPIIDFLANGIRIKYSDNNYVNFTENLKTIVAPTTNHTGDINIIGNLHVEGNITCTENIFATGNLGCGGVLTAGNGVSGTFTNSVIALNGVVTGGT